ncbi:MAG: hypothetical protein ACMUEL_07895 [Flavobacteriales bacterium Tduv]
MILAVHSVAANENDSRGLKPLISKLRYKPREGYAEKAYQAPAKLFYFHSRSLKDHIKKKTIGTVLKEDRYIIQHNYRVKLNG